MRTLTVVLLLAVLALAAPAVGAPDPISLAKKALRISKKADRKATIVHRDTIRDVLIGRTWTDA